MLTTALTWELSCEGSSKHWKSSLLRNESHLLRNESHALQTEQTLSAPKSTK